MIPGVSAEGLALSSAGVCKMNTIRRMSLISVFVCAAMALAGCGKKAAPAPEPDTKAPKDEKAITPPVGTDKDKDGKPKEPPKSDAGKDAPVLDAVALTRELGKNPAAAERYQSKVVRIEGVVTEVKLKPDGKNSTEAEIELQGATDSANKISISATITDKSDVAKLGPGQKVSIQGRYNQLAKTVILISDAKLVTAGAVAFTQVALEAIRREEPNAIAELEKLGVAIRKGGFTHPTYEVTLVGKDLTPEGAFKPAVLMPLSRLVGLHTISTFDIGISDAGLIGLAKLINLRELRLVAEKKIGTRGLETLPKLTGLKVLSLAHAPITDAGLRPLRDMVGLTSLTLANLGITDAGIADLSKLSNLTSLDLAKNKLTDAGIIHLQGLTKLEYLVLEGNQISGKGLADLKALGQLGNLDLSACPVVDAGLEPLGLLPKLRTLKFGGAKISDAGLAHLAKGPELKDLDLSGIAIGDAGLEHLARVKTLTSLRLSKKLSKVTEAGTKKLKTALPELMIYLTND